MLGRQPRAEESGLLWGNDRPPHKPHPGWTAEWSLGPLFGGERKAPGPVLWADGPHGELGTLSGREKLNFKSGGGSQGHGPFIVVAPVPGGSLWCGQEV